MKKIIITAVASLAMLISCKKEQHSPGHTPQEQVPQLATLKATITNGQANDLTREYIYDSAGRLKEIKHTGGNTNNIVEKYNYPGGKVQYRYYANGVESMNSAVDFLINGYGLASKSVSSFYNSENVRDYNGAGFLTRNSYVSNGTGVGYDQYYYTPDNVLDSMAGFSAGANKNYVYVFTYESGKKNSIGNVNRRLGMLGKDQVAPIKKTTLYVYDLPAYPGVRIKYYDLDYTYAIDNAGRIKKQTVSQTPYSVPGGIPAQPFVRDEFLYTYK